jgi:ankyrin repeat protein
MSNGQTGLVMAVSKGDRPIVELLLERGARRFFSLSGTA